MKIIREYQKKRAIKSYIHRLGKDLARRYGRSKIYTSNQVAKTAKDENYNWLHICYAHAMYTSFEHFHQWHDEIGEICDFQAMRQEITDSFFSGNSASFKAVSESTGDSNLGFDIGGIDSE